MSIYKNLKQAFKAESGDIKTLEDAYEEIYRRKTRLEDMDDFSGSILFSIHELIEKGVDPVEAFSEVIDKQYEFVSSDYFKIPLEHYKDDLVSLLSKSVLTSNPSTYWELGIKALASNDKILFNGEEYSLEEIYNKLEKGGY